MERKSIPAVLFLTLLFGPLGRAYVKGAWALWGVLIGLVVILVAPPAVVLVWGGSMLAGAVGIAEHNSRVAKPFKTCPQCAEQVKAAARVCRYRGYEVGPAG